MASTLSRRVNPARNIPHGAFYGRPELNETPSVKGARGREDSSFGLTRLDRLDAIGGLLGARRSSRLSSSIFLVLPSRGAAATMRPAGLNIGVISKMEPHEQSYDSADGPDASGPPDAERRLSKRRKQATGWAEPDETNRMFAAAGKVFAGSTPGSSSDDEQAMELLVRLWSPSSHGSEHENMIHTLQPGDTGSSPSTTSPTPDMNGGAPYFHAPSETSVSLPHARLAQLPMAHAYPLPPHLQPQARVAWPSSSEHPAHLREPHRDYHAYHKQPYPRVPPQAYYLPTRPPKHPKLDVGAKGPPIMAHAQQAPPRPAGYPSSAPPPVAHAVPTPNGNGYHPTAAPPASAAPLPPHQNPYPPSHRPSVQWHPLLEEQPQPERRRARPPGSYPPPGVSSSPGDSRVAAHAHRRAAWKGMASPTGAHAMSLKGRLLSDTDAPAATDTSENPSAVPLAHGLKHRILRPAGQMAPHPTYQLPNGGASPPLDPAPPSYAHYPSPEREIQPPGPLAPAPPALCTEIVSMAPATAPSHTAVPATVHAPIHSMATSTQMVPVSYGGAGGYGAGGAMTLSMTLGGGSGRNLAERKEWTVEEDRQICKSVRRHGFKWRLVAADVPGRSDDAVRNRYNRVKALDHVKPTAEELAEEAKEGPALGSKPVSRRVRAKTSKSQGGKDGELGDLSAEPGEGKESSKESVGTSNSSDEEKEKVERISWSRSEDETIVRSVTELGNKWAKIAERLPGRTEHAIRNRFARLQSLALRGNQIVFSSGQGLPIGIQLVPTSL